MSIHFKFKSAKEFDTVAFAGTVIRVLDLKKAIIEKKKLNKGLDFDLVITDAQSGKVYDDENMQLPRNTSVTVKRIPSQQPGSGLLARMKAEAMAAAAVVAPVLVAQPSPVMLPIGSTPSVPASLLNGAAPDAGGGAQTMEDELAALQSIHEQAEDLRGARLGNKTWTASGGSNADRVMNYYAGGRGGGAPGGRGFQGGGRGPMSGGSGPGSGPGGRGRGGSLPMMSGGGNGGATGPPGLLGMNGNPPPNYVCYRCGTPGHYIQNCPTNGDPEFDQHRVKKKTGIPKSFMKAVNDPSEIPVGAGRTVVNAPWGGLAVIEPQNKHFSKLMAKSGGSATLDQFIANPPDHLACPICKRLMTDAVLIPCCQESACDECLRGALIEKKLTCPLCNTTNMSPEKLLPNKVLRTSVDEFLRRARTEQQEREQLVKEAEEKALARQKAELAAVSTAGRRSGESADATLEIKKSKKDDDDPAAVADDEDDEFGGDIFGAAVDETDDTHSGAAGGAPPTPLPKGDSSASGTGDVGPSRKASDGDSGADGASSAGARDREGDRLPLLHHHPGPMPGPLGGNPMPWPLGPPRGPPGMGFPPQEPWFDGPPPRGAPGPWFDGPPPPWFDGPFPGPGGPGGPGPRGPMKGGRGGRGMPPPGYFGPPPGHPDYFGPPPGHPDFFGPPPPWFDGPMPPFGGGGGRGGGGMWFDGERGPGRGHDDDVRRRRADSRDLGRDGRRAGESKGGPDDKSRDRRPTTRSRSCSRGGGRARGRAAVSSSHGRSRSRSFSRSRKARGRLRSTSRERRRERKSGSRPTSPRELDRENKLAAEKASTPKATVADVKADQVAAPAIDLGFLDDHANHSEGDSDHQPSVADSDPAASVNDVPSNSPKAGSTDSRDARKDDVRRANDEPRASADRRSDAAASTSTRKRSSSPSRRNRSAERPSSRSARSRSRSVSRRRSSNESSRRSRGDTSSSVKRSGERSASTRDSERPRERGSGGDSERPRDTERGSGGDSERPRDKERGSGRDRSHERSHGRERERGGRDRRDRDRDTSKRGRDESDAGDARSGGGDKRRRRSPEREHRSDKGNGRVVTSSKTSSKSSGAGSGGASGSTHQSTGGGRGTSSRTSSDKSRRIEYEDDGASDRKKAGSSSRKRSDDARSAKSIVESQAKKRSVLDRLGPAL